MHRVSTNLTLFFKFFIPIFWVVFFTSFTIAILVYPTPYFGNIPANTFRLIVLAILLSGIGLFYFTLFRLKRVEMDEKFVFVTNYFKNVRYPYHNIEHFEESDFLFLKIVRITLKEPGSFGKRMFFIASKKHYTLFWKAHPALKEQLIAPAT